MRQSLLTHKPLIERRSLSMRDITFARHTLQQKKNVMGVQRAPALWRGFGGRVPQSSHVKLRLMDSEGGLFDGFGVGGVGVGHSGHLLAGELLLDGDDTLDNHLGGVLADDM